MTLCTMTCHASAASTAPRSSAALSGLVMVGSVLLWFVERRPKKGSSKRPPSRTRPAFEGAKQ